VIPQCELDRQHTHEVHIWCWGEGHQSHLGALRVGPKMSRGRSDHLLSNRRLPGVEIRRVGRKAAVQLSGCPASGVWPLRL
jgi:hypothetical protein